MLERLEKLLQRLADPAAPLERAVTDHEDASRLLAAAQERLDAAASRVAQAIPEP
jgi:exodeoxyribonuclease VII small subunit